MPTVSPEQASPGEEITAAKINNPVNALADVINGDLDDDNITSLSGTKITTSTLPATALDSTARGGWITGLPAPNTITYNGNRSYTCVFNSVDMTSYLSAGMRLRFTRTTTAPTQCTDLESSSSQYWTKASPSGISFTDDFTTMAWIKMESYTGALAVIVNRRNASTEGWSFAINSSGQLEMVSLRIASNNRTITSYQSVPLGKWVHVAATMDNSANSHTMYIDGVSVPFSTTTNGTITALVQGSSDLRIGALSSSSANHFDGKIAQVGVFDAVLSAATIQSYASQTLSGSETNCVAAFTFNGDANDSDANANNLSASGSATATSSDTPFAGGATGTTEYGIVTSVSYSSNTTVVVQVPEGHALPTSGGISALAYSTHRSPYGFPATARKWELYLPNYDSSTLITTSTLSNTQAGSQYMTVPVGEWDVDYRLTIDTTRTAQTNISNLAALSTTTDVSGVYSESQSYAPMGGASGTLRIGATHAGTTSVNLTSATTIYIVAGGAATSGGLAAGTAAGGCHYLRARCLYL